ncbi:autoinducer binding domain-containing protein [Thalassobius sp. I31.1]|uniref:helix-turn-helix transcriptional regulator n=1 Tax=Thalassobius sp. I31.1 TaxID=2109912 RepID=UPI000D1BC9AE|nr:autoinducer binding domain-containing protein [Thalassobius sp. I31.1]
MVNDILAQMRSDLLPHCPQGYAAGFNFEGGAPEFMDITFPESWSAEYQRDGLAMIDPVVMWGMEHQGHKNWSELRQLGYPTEIFSKASKYGMRNGTVISVLHRNCRSIIGITHKDETAPDELIKSTYGWLTLISERLPSNVTLPGKTQQYLQLAADDLNEHEMADQIGITIQAIRKRRKTVLKQYGVKTVPAALRIALQRGDVS